ncbi:MAG TPA: ankyrin repeat domain-containing protein [Parachlamydiaceae bacterium]|nr:ankyrin repeat domain-containing protein [Parachlamydiaceae bacterium]
MNINSFASEDLSDLITNYHEQTQDSLEKLSSYLKNTNKRIKFEEWLINNFNPKKAIGADFVWHSRVITIIITNLAASSPPAETQRHEDLLLARLVSKASPPLNGNGIVVKLTNFVHNQAGRILNTQQISHEINTAHLPFTSNILLKRMLVNQDISIILNDAVRDKHIGLVKSIIDQKPKEFKLALNNNKMLFELAISGDCLKIFKLIVEAAPEEFKIALTLKDGSGSNLLHYAAKKNLELIQFMAETAPIEFRTALNLQDVYGDTPVHLIAPKNLELLQFIAEIASEEFGNALTMQNFEGYTPVFLASNNIEILNFMHQAAPNAFQTALTTGISEGHSLLNMIKRLRPHNYQKISKLFEKNSNLSVQNKEIVKRLATSHAWHLSGTTNLTEDKTKKTVVKMDLEGWNSPHWFHMFGKDLEKFKVAYPVMLSDNNLTILKENFNVGANPQLYSSEEKLKRIKDGLATFIITGFTGHAVTVLIWGDRFVICNRGGGSRTPVVFFHFDPQKLDVDDLKKMEETERSGDSFDYKKLFFIELPEKLAFSKKPIDVQMEKNILLPLQTVGNCSFVSPITGVFTHRLLSEVHGIDQHGRLLKEELEKPLIDSSLQADAELTKKIPDDLVGSIEKAQAWYQTWITFEQITILERLIRPLENKATLFEPDHVIIVEVFRKAHLLPLDHHGIQKLDALIDIYINFLEEKERTQFKSDLVFWKNLAKAPLL